MRLRLMTTTLPRSRCNLNRLPVVGNSSAIFQASLWLSNCHSSPSLPIPLEEDPLKQLILNFDSFD
jgi:hypothetical protein